MEVVLHLHAENTSVFRLRHTWRPRGTVLSSIAAVAIRCVSSRQLRWYELLQRTRRQSRRQHWQQAHPQRRRSHLRSGNLTAGGGRRGRLVPGVTLHVLGQVIAPHEASLANGAGELFFAGMRPLVPRQLVAAGEATIAILVRARERSLAGMGARVRLQMRRLEVIFAATRMLAFVDATAGLHRARVRRHTGCCGDRCWRRVSY